MSQDWTTGPAKWAAVLVLGAASIFGIAWGVVTRGPARASAPSPIVKIVPAPAAAEDESPAGPAPSPAPTPKSGAVRQININTATAADLELLPGVGPALAGRIVGYRRANGPFKSIDQLDDVKGIGPRTLEKLRPLVKVE